MITLESAFNTETRFSSAQPRTSAGVHSAALSCFHIKPTSSTCAGSAPRTQRLRVYSHAEHAELGVGDGGVEGGRERERDHAAGVARQNDSIVSQACAGVVRAALHVVLVSYASPTIKPVMFCRKSSGTLRCAHSSMKCGAENVWDAAKKK